MWISSNDALTNLSGLENLETVGNYLVIRDNYALTSLSGLGNLTSVGGFLGIYYNTALTSLGLTGLQRVGGYFEIASNPLLCKSLVEELRNQVLLRKGIWGIIDISGNKECTTP